MTTLDLATGPVLTRAANLIVAHGLGRDDFTDTHGRHDTCGAIAIASGLEPDDWHDQPDTSGDDAWKTRRAAALAALRTLIGHLYPDSRPEDMSRDALIVKAGEWNDHPDRTPAQVATAMRNAARQEATHG